MGKNILILEDEQDIQDMYKMKFESRGYNVMTASNGEEGFDCLAKQLPDIILLDLIMPQMGGYEFLQKLRQNDKTRNIKVCILSLSGTSIGSI